MKATKWFSKLEDFKKFILSKDKFEIEDFEEIFRLYIDSVWYFHFKEKIKWKASDELIDTKLRWVYEMYTSIKWIIEDKSNKAK